MPPRTLQQLRDAPKPPWFWEGFVAPKSFTLLSAYPKVGKTTMLTHMLRSLANGEGFLDRATRAVPILYFSEEADTLLAERADALGFEDSWPIMWQTKEPGLVWEKCIWLMKNFVHVHKEPIIIVDTLARFWNCESENDATQVDHALNPVLELIRNSHAGFVGIHHNRKQGGGGGSAVRGSTALTGGVDIIMELSRVGAHDRSNVRRLSCESRYSETPSLLQLRLDDGAYTVEDMEAVEMEPQVISILQTMEGMTIEDLTFLMNGSEATVRRVIGSLWNRAILHRQGTGKAGSPYTYSLAIPASE